MATEMRPLPVRLSGSMRQLIDQVGAVNMATRALLLLGAHAAGLSLASCERDLALVLAEELDNDVRAALQHAYHQLTQPSRDEPGTIKQPAPGVPVEPVDDTFNADDPLLGIGLAV